MEDGMDIVARLMVVSTMKANREDDSPDLEVTILEKVQRGILAEELFQMAEQKEDDDYTRVGEHVLNSGGMILVGLNDRTTRGLDCKACGFSGCEELMSVETSDIFEGANCLFRVLDMGMALGSALRTADMHNVKTEIMPLAGLAAKRLGLSQSRMVLAVSLR